MDIWFTHIKHKKHTNILADIKLGDASWVGSDCVLEKMFTYELIFLLFQIVLKLAEDTFEVELPDGQEVQFPNRVGMGTISYIRVTGDFKLKSFKIC